MDRLLKLKLEMVYRVLPVEQARQTFEELKGKAPRHKDEVPVKRKLRIVTKNK